MKTAVVLFNLGGPDGPEAVRPFLVNLFSDPAILRVPAILRWPLARFIAWRRAETARGIYAKLGGGSPLLANTEAQAMALEAVLGTGFKTFIAMRYWHPLSDATVAAVKAWGADRIVLLPLYPQFSTSTTASSLRVWREAAARAGLAVPTRLICCYPDEAGFVAAYAAAIAAALDRAGEHGRPRLLLSAHGVPKRFVTSGDPYQWQCERTAAAIVSTLGQPGLDSVVCYQSRVGPLEWIGPATEDEVVRAGRDGVPLVVAPIAFVSEHSETLYEIGEEYRHLADESGVPHFESVPAVGTTPTFIDGLAALVRAALAEERGVRSNLGARICPPGFSGCCQGVA